MSGLLLLVLGLAVAGQALALDVDDVVQMTKAGLSDEVIISKVEVSGAVFSLDVQQLIELKKAGVSDKVLAAMIKTQGPGAEKNAAETMVPLTVSTDPPACRAFVDDFLVGVTPYVGNLRPGKHTVRVELAYYKPWATEVEAKRGEAVDLEVPMTILRHHIRLQVEGGNIPNPDSFSWWARGGEYSGQLNQLVFDPRPVWEDQSLVLFLSDESEKFFFPPMKATVEILCWFGRKPQETYTDADLAAANLHFYIRDLVVGSGQQPQAKLRVIGLPGQQRQFQVKLECQSGVLYDAQTEKSGRSLLLNGQVGSR